MTISYDFIAFSGRITENSWSLGMKAVQGEVPLDVVIPSLQTSKSNDEEIIGVLTKEGISRESTDVMEFYRYLRQLNPKSNHAFGYNEVVIRNIHSRLNSLKINDELQVHISYTERKENYIPSTYNIKLLGIFEASHAVIQNSNPVEIDNTQIDMPNEGITTQEDTSPENTSPENISPENISVGDTTRENILTDKTENMTNEDKIPIIPKDFSRVDPDIPVYKTTNTLEKLIVFTRTLQVDLDEVKKSLALMAEQIQLLESERAHYRELQDLMQDMLDRITYLESCEKRIHSLEAERHKIEKIQQTLAAFFRTSNRQTHALLKEINDEIDPTISDIDVDI